MARILAKNGIGGTGIVVASFDGGSISWGKGWGKGGGRGGMGKVTTAVFTEQVSASWRGDACGCR